MIKKAIEAKDAIYSFLQKENNLSENDIMNLMTEDFLNSHYVIVKNEKIVEFIETTDLFGVEILTPYYEGDIEIIVSELKKYLPNAILTWSSKLEKDTIVCNLHSSINYEYSYDVPYCVTFDSKNQNILRDVIEESLFSDIDFNDLTVLNLSSKEYQSFLKNNSYLTWLNGGNRNLAGFFFLDKQLYEHDRILMLVKNDVILGCIVYCCLENYYSIAFIDVNMFYRNKGLSKKLILELTKHLKDFPLVLSKETSMGSLCNMHKHFKEAPFKVPVINSAEWKKIMEGKND